MLHLRRKLLSQNFLSNRKVVSLLVGSSFIGKNDLVLEVGPGKGIITTELLKRSGHVMAVEIDAHWYQFLQQHFPQENLTLYHADILSFDLPKLPYKVFANIPFAIEGKIIRKLIDDPHPPSDCFLVVMEELAHRLTAARKENLFSILHKPWFDFSIPYHFKNTDFYPVPNVDAVLFRFTLKKQPFVPWQKRKQYQQFVTRGFGQGLPVQQNLKRFYGIQKIENAFQQLGVSKIAKPTHLSLQQWIALYTYLHK